MDSIQSEWSGGLRSSTRCSGRPVWRGKDTSLDAFEAPTVTAKRCNVPIIGIDA